MSPVKRWPVKRLIFSGRGQDVGVSKDSKPTETQVCHTSRQSRHHHEISFRPCSILGRSAGARCHTRGALSSLSSVLMYYVGLVGHEQRGCNTE